MARRTELLRQLKQKKWFLAALAAVLLAALVTMGYLRMSRMPISGTDISPAADPAAWTYTLADGTALSPDADGRFALPAADAVVYCTRTLDGLQPAGLLNPDTVLAVSGDACETAVLASDDSADGPLDDAALSLVSDEEGLFTLGEAESLTLAVRFQTDEASVKQLPTVQLFANTAAYNSRQAFVVVNKAMLAGAFLVIAAFMAALFLFQLYHRKSNWDLLMLALLALACCLRASTFFGLSGRLQAPQLAWAFQLLPGLMLLWLLWYHTDGRTRRYGWLLPILCIAGVAAGAVWQQSGAAGGAQWASLMRGILLPAVRVLALAWCGWLAWRGSRWYRDFFRGVGILALCAGMGVFVSFLRDGICWRMVRSSLQEAFRTVDFYGPMSAVTRLLLLLFFLLAIRDFIHSVAERESQIQALELQTRYAAEHADRLRRSLDETRALRHEERHHVQALLALCREGDITRVESYLARLGRQLDDVPVRYTDHALIDALVSSGAARAKKLGVDFHAAVVAPAQLAMEDTDLAVLLSNLIDNALEALACVPAEKERRMQLRVEAFEQAGLFVGCSNTFTGRLLRDEHGGLLTTKERAGHGLGLRAMRRVAEKYGGELAVTQEGQCFHVRTYLYLSQTGKKQK